MSNGIQRPRVAPSKLRMGSMVGKAAPRIPVAANGGVQAQVQVQGPWSPPIAYDAQGRARVTRPAPTAAPVVRPIAGPARPSPLTPSDPHAESGWGMDINEWLRQNSNQRDSHKLDGERDNQDHALNQQRLEKSRGEALLGETSNANRSGLLYSTALGKRRGAVETDFNDRATDANAAHDRRAADRSAALEQIGTITANGKGGFTATGGAKDDYARIEQGAVDRAGERDRLREPPVADEPDTPTPAPAQASAAAAAPAGRGKPQNVVKGGKFYHVYNGGKSASDWVYIRPASGS